jgi:hypothetical protein
LIGTKRIDGRVTASHAWDEQVAQACIDEILGDAVEGFSARDLWPPHQSGGLESSAGWIEPGASPCMPSSSIGVTLRNTVSGATRSGPAIRALPSSCRTASPDGLLPDHGQLLRAVTAASEMGTAIFH